MSTIIERIHLATIPSADADRSIAFYASLGFEKRADFPFGEGGRWVELFPPGGVHAQLCALGADVDALLVAG